MALTQTIQIDLRTILAQPKTYLRSGINAAVTSLSVQSNIGFSTDNFAILGSIGEENTEIVRILGLTGNQTISTTVATKFAHAPNSLLQRILFNQFQVLKSTDGGLVWSTVATVDIQPDTIYQEYTILNYDPSALYSTRFYNSIDGSQSEFSNNTQERGGLIDLIVQDVERKTKVLNGGSITPDDIFETLADVDMAIASELVRQNPNYYQDFIIIDLLQDVYEYELPENCITTSRVLIRFGLDQDYVESNAVDPAWGDGTESFSDQRIHYTYRNTSGVLVLGLKVVPTESVVAGIKISYVKEPQRIYNASDSLNTPNPKFYMHIIKAGVLAQLYMFYKGNQNLAASLQSTFERGLMDIVQTVNRGDASSMLPEDNTALPYLFN